MDRSSLLEHLQIVETEMHHNVTRKNQVRLSQLLHPDFIEFGRSGRSFTRAEILQELHSEIDLPEINSSNYELVMIADNAALLTYASAHITPAGDIHRQTLCCSLWINTSNGWQLRFHRGTAVE